VFTGVVVAIVAIGCGRVDLEDLTPEAVRTQQASLPTPTQRPATSSTPGATQPAGAGIGDAEAGRLQYSTWCTGCHESGRLDAPVILGNTYDPAEWIPILRTPGDKARHPSSYTVMELNDNAYDDIFAYIASQ
jgi:hypothetical protein